MRDIIGIILRYVLEEAQLNSGCVQSTFNIALRINRLWNSVSREFVECLPPSYQETLYTIRDIYVKLKDTSLERWRIKCDPMDYGDFFNQEPVGYPFSDDCIGLYGGPELVITIDKNSVYLSQEKATIIGLRYRCPETLHQIIKTIECYLKENIVECRYKQTFCPTYDVWLDIMKNRNILNPDPIIYLKHLHISFSEVIQIAQDYIDDITDFDWELLLVLLDRQITVPANFNKIYLGLTKYSYREKYFVKTFLPDAFRLQKNRKDRKYIEPTQQHVQFNAAEY